MAGALPRRATAWLLLYYLTSIRGISFAGTRTSSTTSGRQASDTEDSDPQPRGPRVGVGTTYSSSEVNNQPRQRVHDEDSWLEGFELEDYEATPQYSDPGYTSDYKEVLSSLHSHPLLQVPCRMAIRTPQEAQEPFSWISDSSLNAIAKPRPVKCFCDTGAQKTVMSARSAQMAGLWSFLDRRYADKSEAVGVGGSTCRVLGRIPPGVATLNLYGHVDLPSPAIVVLEDLCGVDLLLGLDFLREYDAVLDLRLEELQLSVHGNVQRIPFIKPRGGSAVSGKHDQRYEESYTDVQCTNRVDAELDQSDCYEDEEGGVYAFQQPLDMSGV